MLNINQEGSLLASTLSGIVDPETATAVPQISKTGPLRSEADASVSWTLLNRLGDDIEYYILFCFLQQVRTQSWSPA